MKRAYIFDIDGTLSNVEHRLHHITDNTVPANWPAFFEACDQDPPIPHMVELVHAIAAHDDILFVTGRSDQVRRKTLNWLHKTFGDWIAHADIYMRKTDDHRADTVVKSELLDQVIADGWTPIMIFEDRTSVVNMWRERGIPCCQVASGDF